MKFLSLSLLCWGVQLYPVLNDLMQSMNKVGHILLICIVILKNISTEA